jgi:integrase
MPDSTPLMRSLADVLSDLERDTSLSPTRRRDLRSAVRRFCDLVDRDPARVPASIAAVQGAVNGLTSGGTGVSPKTHQNLRANLLAALRHGNATALRSVPLTAQWQSLHELLPNKRMTSGLSRFMRYCSAQGIAPDAVDDAVVVAFMNRVRSATFAAKPNDIHRRTCRLWNEAADRLEGWPRQCLVLPDHRAPRTSIPLTEFAPSFRRDVERYLDWLTNPDPFDDERPRRALKSRSIKQQRTQIVLAASAWVHRGHDMANLGSLADLVATEAAKDILRHYLTQNEPRSPAFLGNLAQTLFSIAKVWVRVDPEHLEGLRAIRSRLPPVSPGMTAKNRALLRQFEDPETLRRLLGMPRQLLLGVRRGKVNGEHAAIQVQLAVAIELLLMAPIRMSNLVSIGIGQELVKVGGRTGSYRLVIDEADTKNTEPIEFALPVELSEMIDLYTRGFQPRLAAGDSPYLFPARAGGGHKSQMTLAQQLQVRLYERLGFKMTPHQFRHLSAWLYLRRNQGDYVTVQKLLGHKNIKTTMNFYAKLDTEMAARRYDEIVAAERESYGKAPLRADRRRQR